MKSKIFYILQRLFFSEATVACIHLSLTVKLQATESMHQMLVLCVDYSDFVRNVRKLSSSSQFLVWQRQVARL